MPDILHDLLAVVVKEIEDLQGRKLRVQEAQAAAQETYTNAGPEITRINSEIGEAVQIKNAIQNRIDNQ